MRTTQKQPHGSVSLSRLDSLPMGSLTSEALLTCSPQTLTATHNVTSSRESADGVTPCALPDGLTIDLFGRPLAHASRSVEQGSRKAQATVATSGLLSIGSSQSETLTHSLVSRLQERLASIGSTVYVQTWKRKRTPLGRLFWEHTASAPHTSDSGYTGLRLPTIVAAESKGTSRKRFLGSPHFRGAKMSEGLRLCEDDPTYLSPWFAALVMGFPMAWQACMDTAMQSFPKSRRNSSKRS